jgi:metallo-beta-lactamase family protein
MAIKLTSYGAAQEVTGSCHLLNINGFRIVVDCGLWQGGEENYLKNWDELGFDAKDIDAVILTHAHLDHCGRLPRLFANKYKGKIYLTPPTAKLARIILDDNLKITLQKSSQMKLPVLYSPDDLAKTYSAFEIVDYYQTTKLSGDINFTFHNAGHILGSAFVEIKANDPRNSGASKTIIFSGDIGGEDMPLVKDIDYLDKADWVVCESTYGDRLHENLNTRDQKLIQAVQRVTSNNSTLMIAVFAIERTQDILEVLNNYYENHLDFKVPIFLDSPMAARATEVYKQYTRYFKDEAQDILKTDRDLFDFPHLKVTNQTRDSKKINSLPPPKIVLAGSGMLEGGRMMHHLAHYMNVAKNHLLLTGFQVPGTVGHKVLNGATHFKYYDHSIQIKAMVDQIDGFSAHGDQAAMLKWLKAFGKNTKKVFLTHGHGQAFDVFADKIKNQLGISAEIVEFNKTNILD